MDPKKQEVINLLMNAASQYRRGYEAGVTDALAVYAPEPPAEDIFLAGKANPAGCKPLVMPKPRKKKRKNPWAHLTPEQKAARVAAMRKARGLPPASTS